MSHVTEGTVKFMDLDALEEAVQQHGATLVKGQTTYKWFGRFLDDWNSERASVRHGTVDRNQLGKCAHAIRPAGWRPGDYEVGLVAQPDGSYQAVYDTYSTGHKIEKCFGQGLGVLAQSYAANVAEKTLKAEGWVVERTKDAAGVVHLNVRDSGGTFTGSGYGGFKF